MAKKKKNGLKIGVFAVIVVMIGILAVLASGMFEKPQNSVNLTLYFVDGETSTLKTEPREISGETNGDILGNALAELKLGPKLEGLKSSIPENVKFNGASLKNNVATIDVSKEYSDMKAGEELLCRGSIVWTLTDLSFVEYVSITVDGRELTKADGSPIGNMSREDVVLDKDISPEPESYVTVKLYFANEDATGLGIEERKIEANPNEIEKKVVEQLIAGPTDSHLYPTIPEGTKIRDIKTAEGGICYVDLSAEFVTKHNGGSTGELLTIYSIVNSLTELSNVKKVQFLIEGEKQDEYKGHIDFSKPFEHMDLDI